MSRNVDITPKTADVYNTTEHGDQQKQNSPIVGSKQCGSRFQAGDDDTEAPPVPSHHEWEAQVTKTTRDDEKVVAETRLPQCRKKSAPQLAPAMEPEKPQQTVTPSATAAPSPPPGAHHDVTMTANDLERGEIITPPPPPPPLLQRPALVPGAFQVTGPGIHRFGRRRPSDDQRTVMTPVAAEIVQETPLVVAVPAPTDEQANWWTKRRNQRIVVAGVLTLVITFIVVVTVLTTLGKDDGGDTSLLDPTPPPTSPQTPPMSPDPTTAFPTTDPPTNTTTTTTQSPTTLSPSTPVPTNTTMTTATPNPVPTPVPTTAPPTAWQWKQMGQDIDGEAAGDRSGVSTSLSADGTTVAIGAYLNDGNGSQSGHVRVYQWSGSGWIQLGNDMDGVMASSWSGISISLSANSTTLAIGAPYNGTASGQVRVYQWDGGDWVQLGNGMDGEAAYDESGRSISLSADGNTVAIGAKSNDGNGDGSGHVRVYQWDGDNWVQLGNDMDGEAAGDWSGESVSLSADGTTVAIGAPRNGSSGHVRVYQWNGGGWVQLGNDMDGEVAGDYSGDAVSLSADGTAVAIGAAGNDSNGDQSGHVRVYQLTGNDWIQVGSDLDGKSAGDYSGESVSLSADGTTVAIGAPGGFSSETKAGYVSLYRLAGDQWIQVGSDLNGEAVGDKFGWSVSLSTDGLAVAVGAPDNSGEAGHVRVFRLEQQ